MGGKARALPTKTKAGLTHFDARGKARMVNVSPKPETHRVAVARGRVSMAQATALRIEEGRFGKGDVLAVARLAGISGLKQTSQLIPLCHPLRISGVDLSLVAMADDDDPHVLICAEVQAIDRTGVEMEAMTAVSIAALTVYDMCKAMDRGMRIESVELVEKRGGKSGHWLRNS